MTSKSQINSDIIIILKELKECLEKDMLYSERVLSGVNLIGVDLDDIEQIDLACSKCNMVRPFNRVSMRSKGGGATKTGAFGNSAIYQTPGGVASLGYPCDQTIQLIFQCVSCKNKKEYYLNQTIVQSNSSQSGDISFEKVGEFPRLGREKLSSDLSKLLGEDKQDYLKAKACLQHKMGKGAFAYLRGIVERRQSGILDLVQNEVESRKNDPECQVRIDAIAELRKTGATFSSKELVVKQVLPVHLRPGGHDPLGLLFGVLSEGVHFKGTDTDCLEQAEKVDLALTYLVSNLSALREKDHNFEKALSVLAKKGKKSNSGDISTS